MLKSVAFNILLYIWQTNKQKNNVMNNESQNTILKQLGGAARIYAMTNAKAVVCTKTGVQIMFPRNKYLAIDAQSNDVYTMTAFTLNGRTLETKTTFEQKDIFNSELMGMFEFSTGMIISF